MRFFLSLILFNLLFLSPAFATGPSYIESEMNPVAINSRGDVLCYTRFQRNEMGAHRPMPIVYGYCILTQDSIIHYTMKVLEWNDDNIDLQKYNSNYNLWESIYNGIFKEKYLMSSVRNKYNFVGEGIDAYQVNKKMFVSEFKEMKGVDLHKTHQKALFGATSKNNYPDQDNKVYVSYDFGNIVILQNNISEEIEACGSVFSYINYLFRDIGYEINRVTGVLFVHGQNSTERIK